MRTINYRRGGLRAWIALSLLWSTAVAIVAYGVGDRGLPWNSPGLVYWTSSDEARVWDFPADWDIQTINDAYSGIQMNTPFHKNCVHVPNKDPKDVSLDPCDLIDIVQEKDLHRQLPSVPGSRLLIVVTAMVLPPLALLAAFSLSCWVIAGFSPGKLK
jgi:hypothetical protein